VWLCGTPPSDRLYRHLPCKLVWKGKKSESGEG
jgi:hypothetical protein